MLIAGLIATLSAIATAISPSGCNYVASARFGSDSAPGTLAAPFRTVDRLFSVLGPGETGCLRDGVYDENVTVRRGGVAGAPVTLRSYPGETATIRGRLYIVRGADYTTVEYLRLDGIDHSQDCAPLVCPSPSVSADHATFLADDVTTEHTAICFVLGDATGVYGRADYTVIQQSRIHDCGHLPATNHQHGIYVQASTGSRIIDNYIYNNADRGIQLYPEGDHTLISGNVIEGNGEGIVFGAFGNQTSSDNLVTGNLISDSLIGDNVGSYYGPNDAVGRGNLVSHNCIGIGIGAGAGPLGSSGISNAVGFSLRDNVRIAAHASGAGAAIRQSAGSACWRLLHRSAPGPNGAQAAAGDHGFGFRSLRGASGSVLVAVDAV